MHIFVLAGGGGFDLPKTSGWCLNVEITVISKNCMIESKKKSI